MVLTIYFCFVEFVDSLRDVYFYCNKVRFFMTRKDTFARPTALKSGVPHFEIIRQWPGRTVYLKL